MSYLKSGEHHTRYYNIKSRCYKTSHPFYKDYGGRGIKMSDEWKNNKKDFIWWCENSGYKKGLQIDRIDNNGDYTGNNKIKLNGKEIIWQK